MRFPSDVAGSTTEQVGFFEVSAELLAQWLLIQYGRGWRLRPPTWESASDAFHALIPQAAFSREALIPCGRWTLLLNNTPLGTDVGLLPGRAAETLECRAIRAVSIEDTALYPARMLDVHTPRSSDVFKLERSIAAANDGGRWVFETSGEPYDFEDQCAYRRRLKASRFTSAMLADYLEQLGVPRDLEPDWKAARVLERAEQSQP
ncbi:hypothetical protein R8Z57_14955 [Microbacterium sp. M3]|uniref:Uncharacterized protein n=1 Tax=Microbacterium arthrosphaerae TaxID=792652 RepID=A0ABU4H410_9MICO|nr:MULTISPECIES: hypothetical protein [Microbacterium]MDW4574077.1 hypothetical protein [Microbacterium arthrosphaerae]MDW7607932.1 hypothetical protein [Microbacterium sp. M3]